MKILHNGWLKRCVPRILTVALILTIFVGSVFVSPTRVYAANNIWTNVNGGNWSDHGNWSLGHDPDATESAIMGAAFNAGSTVTIDAAATCLDMDWTGATNSPTLTFGADVTVWGSLTTIAAMTITATNSFSFTFRGIGNITTNTLIINCKVTISTGANVTLADAFSSNGQRAFSVSAGTLDTGNFSMNVGTFGDLASAAAKTMTLGSSVVSCTSWSFPSAGLTVTANTATINITGTGACALGSANWNGASFNLNGTAHTVSGAATGIATFTRNGTATNANTVTFTSGTTLTCTDVALIGNSRANQLLAQSTTLGTAAVITSTNKPTFTNVDLMDITLTNAQDYSGQADVGDCGGNTGITFPAGVAQTYTDTGDHKASTAGNWTSRIPLVGIDDVTIGATITYDMPRMGKSVTFTGTPTVTLSNSYAVYGSLTVPTTASNTFGTQTLTFRGRGAYTFTSGGKSFSIVIVRVPSGQLTLQDNLTIAAGAYLGIYAGTFIDGNKDISSGVFESSGDITRTITKGTGTWTLTYTAVTTKWTISGTNVTLTDAGTIISTNSTANAQTFAGGGLTYNNITVAGAGNYALTITGNNTFNNLTVDRSVANKTLVLTGTVQTVADFQSLTSGVRTVTITNGGLTKTGGGVTGADYLVISGNTALPINTWYASTNSVNGGGNANWTFTDAAGTVVSLAATGLTFDKDGVVGGSLSGNYTARGVPYVATGNFEYGPTAAYGTTIGTQTLTSLGVFTTAVPVGLTPGGHYHYRANIINGLITTNGGDLTFDLTMPSITTVAATGITMNAAGVTGGNFNGDVTALGLASDTYAFVEYGLNIAYGSSTASVTRNAIGAFSIPIPNNLTPGETYHWRMNIQNGATIVNGADSFFTFTMPTLSTDAVTGNTMTLAGTSVTLNQTISAMGEATSIYTYWEWGDSIAYGNTTTPTLRAGIGSFSTGLTHIQPDKLYYYRAVERINSTPPVYRYGAMATFTIPATFAYKVLSVVPFLLAGCVLFVALFALGGLSIINIVAALLGGVSVYFVASYLVTLLW